MKANDGGAFAQRMKDQSLQRSDGNEFEDAE